MSVRRRRPEDSIQRAVCQHLWARGSPGVVWWHTPNGGKRSRIEAAIMKGLGVRAGVASLQSMRATRLLLSLRPMADGQPECSFSLSTTFKPPAVMR
jgi:hypothetical protein